MICYILYMTKFVISLILGGEFKVELTELTFRNVIDAIAVIVLVWFVVKNYLDMRDRSIKGLTRKQGWDKAAKVIEEKEKIWDEGLAKLKMNSEQAIQNYDKRFDNIEKSIKDNHADTENKIGEVKEELLLLTECMRAVLDGLHQQGCNGKVTEASQKLDNYLVGLVGKN